MSYNISGEFIEACDCYLICPCWLDADPDEGHCLGLFAWIIGDGSRIGDVDVSGRLVVSVSSQEGYRRGGAASTAIFVDRGATDAQYAALVQGFSGTLDGPLGGLAAVSGEIRQRDRADIAVNPSEDGWRVTVDVPGLGGAQRVVNAGGQPKIFDHAEGALTLQQTALSSELGNPSTAAVTAQQVGDFAVDLAALHAGSFEATGRSGMRGRFVYALAAEPIG